MFKKSFILELEYSLKYPSIETICNMVEKYCKENNELLKWENKNEPISFYIDDVLYGVEIHMMRGGYELLCKEK